MDENNNVQSGSPVLIIDFGKAELNKILPPSNGVSKWISFNGKEYGELSEIEMVEKLVKADKLEKIPLLAKKYANEREKIKEKILKKSRAELEEKTTRKHNKSRRISSSSEDDVEFVEETLPDKRRTRGSSGEEVPSKKSKAPPQKNASSTAGGNQSLHRCPICSQLLPSILSLTRHVTNVHVQLNNTKCDKCGKVFSNPPNLRRHQRTVHRRDTK